MGVAMRLARLFRIAVTLALLALQPALAQQVNAPASPILTIDSERLFTDSAFGQRVAREIEAEQSVLLAENRKIEAELAAEEKRLTELRKEMAPEDFRAIADAFDQRVQEIRRTQDAKVRAISEMRDRQRATFIQAARPVLIDLMRTAGASMILERRSILVSTDAADITDRAVERLNQAIGDGASTQADQ